MVDFAWLDGELADETHWPSHETGVTSASPASPAHRRRDPRPCRAPHKPLAEVGRIGGGQIPMPGEVSLARYGVRFLDELPECRRHILEVPRQPLEKSITWIQRFGLPYWPAVFSRTW
jgi:predicted ATPase with chaperone activity